MRAAIVVATPGASFGQTSGVPPVSLKGPPLDPHIVELTGTTLVELIGRAVSRTPERVALALRRGLADERWTYWELLPRGRSMPRRRRESHVVVRYGPALPCLAGRPAREATQGIGGAIAALAGSG